ncbi:MAG TPA: zinc ABC transporter substrate-binding protein [bacterium]|nr:zinc ABC transporter substrate-binding protein [bacterium]HPS28969.1 zinc ABC transporter substrate-binding protein [bacterium]
MKKILLSALIFIPFLLFSEIRVIGTIPDYAALAKEIGGERVKSEALIKGTQNPHFADALPSHIMKLNKADLLISTGLGLESGWLPALLNNARNKNILTGANGFLEASQYVTLKDVPQKIDRSMGDVHPGGNPHFYTAPDQLFKIAQEIKNRLVQIDPDGRDYYEKNWTDFKAKFELKTAEWKKMIEPFKGTKIVVYHESWVYLLDWLGFEKVAALEPKPGIPPSAGHVAEVLHTIEGKNVKFLFQEIYHPTSFSKKFADKAGLKLLVLPSMTGAEKGTDSIWEKFDTIINKITKGE